MTARRAIASRSARWDRPSARDGIADTSDRPASRIAAARYRCDGLRPVIVMSFIQVVGHVSALSSMSMQALIRHAHLKAFFTRSWVIGVSRRRLPVNAAKALLIARPTSG